MVKVTAGFIDVYSSNDDQRSQMKCFNNEKECGKLSSEEHDSDSAISFGDSSDEEFQEDDMQTTIQKLKKEANLPIGNFKRNEMNKERQEKIETIKKRFQTNSPADTLSSPRLGRKQYSLHKNQPDNQNIQTKPERPTSLCLNSSWPKSSSYQFNALCSPMVSRRQFRRQNTVPDLSQDEKLMRSHSSSQLHMLHSPKLTRRMFTKSAKDLVSISPSSLVQYDITDSISPSSLIRDDVTGVNMRPRVNSDVSSMKVKSAPSTPIYDDDGRSKRKQIDITKSTAYKEIYAHNLRLYSAVLAKQIASSGQVGREMNELRRNKIKEKALREGDSIPRSRSFACADHKTSPTSYNPRIRQERSNSAGSTEIHMASIKIRQKFLAQRAQSQEDILCSPVMENRSFENDTDDNNNNSSDNQVGDNTRIDTQSCESNEKLHDRARRVENHQSEFPKQKGMGNQSKVQTPQSSSLSSSSSWDLPLVSNAESPTISLGEAPLTIKEQEDKTVSPSESKPTSNNNSPLTSPRESPRLRSDSTRSLAASRRSEYFRSKIQSFDETLLETTQFLNKIKTMKNENQNRKS